MLSDYYFLIYTPINIILFKFYPDINRLLFYCTISCISIYDILFYNENYSINTNLLEYNYCGDLISKLSFQYFITDSLFNTSLACSILILNHSPLCSSAILAAALCACASDTRLLFDTTTCSSE